MTWAEGKQGTATPEQEGGTIRDTEADQHAEITVLRNEEREVDGDCIWQGPGGQGKELRTLHDAKSPNHKTSEGEGL